MKNSVPVLIPKSTVIKNSDWNPLPIFNQVDFISC